MIFPRILTIGLCFLLLPSLRAELLVSEVMPGTEHGYLDENGLKSDWIELYNAGDSEIELGLFCLTDDPESLSKWQLPEARLKPGQFLVVFASGQDRRHPRFPHANFKLKSEGEYLALVLMEEQKITQEFSPSLPSVGKGQSCGYLFEGERLVGDHLTIFSRATPGAINDAPAVWPRVKDTKFSVDRGFYQKPFKVEVRSATEGAEIRYTLDGSPPSPQEGLIYEAPILIESTSILRVMAWKENHLSTDIDTASYIFPSQVMRQPAHPEGWPTHYEAKVNPFFARIAGKDSIDEEGVIVKYAMASPESLDAQPEELERALLALPSISIVTDKKHFFDSRTGIHVKPEGRGRKWERPVSVELIDPQGREPGFQIDAGIRVRGGHSRSAACQKHGYRLYFRKDYGAGELDYPLFGDEGVRRFDDIDLRTAQNYSYHYSDSTHHTLVRDVFSRDCQRDLGQPYTRSRYYHLYLNGLYWGVYQTQEHAEASYGARYFGGEDEEFDVLKAKPSSDGRATDGKDQGWRRLWTIANAMAMEESQAGRLHLLRRLQGLNENGVSDPLLPSYLNVDNLIDYMLVIFLTGNFDGPITQFAGNFATNNWFSIWRRNGREGFHFFCHDSEHSLAAEPGTVEINRVGPFLAGASYDQFNPQWLHQQLTSVDWYCARFRARAEEVLSVGGILSRSANLARMRHRAQEVGRAMLAECARWGWRAEQPVKTKKTWAEAITWLEQVLERRAELVPKQLATAMRFPRGVPARELVEAPLFNPVRAPRLIKREKGGTFAAESGVVYFRMDGLDPMEGEGVRAGSLMARADTLVSKILVGEGSPVRIDIAREGSLAEEWTRPGFEDLAWREGKGGIGYDQREDYRELIGIDVEKDLYGKGTTVLARYTFDLPEVPAGDLLTLRLKVEDGFVAHLNGVEVGRENVFGPPEWNGKAVSRPDDVAVRWLTLDITKHMTLLRRGKNVLAIRVVNERERSSDLLLLPELSLGNEVLGTVIELEGSDRLKARILSENQWGVLLDRELDSSQQVRPVGKGDLLISEVMYHPREPDESARAIGLTEKSDFEFLELLNVASDAVDLTGMYCREGIYFFLASSRIVDPGKRVVIARNMNGMSHRYPQCTVMTTYQGNLGNGRESIVIRAANGEEIASVTYDDEDPWPSSADGKGYSLVLRSPSAKGEPSDPGRWKASDREGGSPGQP